MRTASHRGPRIPTAVAAVLNADCPCDHCHNKERCGSLGQACADFQAFVQTGAVRRNNRYPSPARYDLVFSGDGDEKKTRRVVQ